VIILHEIQSKLAELKELVEQKAHHPYLIKNMNDAPSIDEDKLLLLISIFDQLNLSDIEKNTYILATMLIQLALDTHDYVRPNSIEDDLKSQQLMVLAGDYYSGLYYKHLAGINNVSLIRDLSVGIKEINENKILIYERQVNDIDQMLMSLIIIEGGLFNKLMIFFQRNQWSELILNFLLVKRLLNEKNQYLNLGSSVVAEAMEKLLYAQNGQNQLHMTQVKEKDLINAFDQAIERSIQLMDSGKENLPQINEILIERMNDLKNKHQSMVKTFVEEG
jgi:heptaprenyl diphosphate synthase